MIVKIDHVAFNTNDLDSEVSSFLEKEYIIEFEEKGLENLDIKRDLMGEFSEVHDISLLRSSNKVAIEVVSYGHTSSKDGYISLEGGCIEVNSYDVEESMRFWKCLGFLTNGFELMEFKSPLDIRYIMHFKPVKEKGFNQLDDNGFSSMALITNNILKEEEFLKRNGFFTTGIRQLVVNNKKLDIFFVKGSSGEIVEIIGV